MRRVLIACVLTGVVAGCGDETGLLEPGAAALLHDEEEGGKITIDVPAKGPDGSAILRTVAVPSGTRVIVLEDYPAKDPILPELRLVEVRVDEGEHRGLVGGVNRQELRRGR